MNIEEIRLYCLQKSGVTEDFPFDDEVLTFKILGKIFCLSNLHSIPLKINLKCDPDYAIELRERYEAVTPGYHMSKKHWNTICVADTIEPALVYSLIDHSYDCVVKGMPKKQRNQLK
ncbi:MmcQ/YjbR family DNA-binding protein [Vaginella massiliensis]|uniref:MmcQ/YjbR family DNA-binding protein n=1 Tax=Vaginella massiliensis TaxID=1816680 RepID=UPI0008386F25|nr:MmcQ/YjbR family DNA-binding protein [Vaginella massiliensis]